MISQFMFHSIYIEFNQNQISNSAIKKPHFILAFSVVLAIRNMVDASTRKSLSGIPLLQTKAGPRDKEIWVQRLKEEYQALIRVHFFFFIQFLTYYYSELKPLTY